MILAELLSVNNVVWTIGSYQLCLIELLATVLGLWSFIEIVRRKIAGLVIAVFSVSITAALFYQLRLYSDMILMMYYVVAAICAIVAWRRNRNRHGGEVCVARLSLKRSVILFVGMLVAIVCLRFIAAHVHLWLPGLFPEPAAFAWADATTTVLGISASVLMIRQKSECMLIWFISDLISTVVYQKSGVYFLSGVYFIYVLCDAFGAVSWARCSVQQTDLPDKTQ